MTNLHQAFDTEVAAVRASLRGVIFEANQALVRMEQGQRHSLNSSGTVLGGSAATLEEHSVRLALLLNYAGSDLLDAEHVQSVLTGRV